MADGVDTIDLIEPHDKPMKPGAMDATPNQSNAYRKLLESKGIKQPSEYKTPEEIAQRRRMNDWAEQLSNSPQTTVVKHSNFSEKKPLEPVEQSA